MKISKSYMEGLQSAWYDVGNGTKSAGCVKCAWYHGFLRKQVQQHCVNGFQRLFFGNTVIPSYLARGERFLQTHLVGIREHARHFVPITGKWGSLG